MKFLRLTFYGSILLIALFCNACTTSGDTSPAAAASPATTEQASIPLQRFWVTETHVKPEMMTQFREFVEKESLPAYQKAGYKQQSMYTTASLGESFEFITIRPIESLQQFDEPSFITKALGEEGARKWAAKRATMIVSAHSYITQARPELSIAPTSNEPAKLAFVIRQSITPGRSADFENLIKNEALPIIKKANPKGYIVRKVGTGGDLEEYHTVVLMDSFADYEKWTATLTKEGYDKVAAKRAGIVMHRELAVYRYVPELSLRPQVVAEKK